MSPPTQDEVLARKGYALKSGLGLQIWGDNFPDGASAGDASTGTAERQARIGRRRQVTPPVHEPPAAWNADEGGTR